MSTNAEITLWGTMIGAVSWVEDREIGVFQYAPGFVGSGIEVSPITMPLREAPYEFPALSKETFRGLPGLLADSLPDKYGNAMIDAWLATQGRAAQSSNPVERLCYIGNRGMGALEFKPATGTGKSKQTTLEIEQLIELAALVLNEREKLEGRFSGRNDAETVREILKVGTSAGGARAKAILSWNPQTNEFRSGQVDLQQGFEPWLMKFDGVTNNGEHGIADPQGFGKIEYVYYLMAKKAGIEMMECRLHHEGGRSHFMTQRFDRTRDGKKVHMQTLGGIAHYDYRMPAAYSYEQCFLVMKQLGMSRFELEQQFRRTVFNVVARNQDDHVKNISFLMDRKGKWSLSPAYDVSYAWNPSGDWTSKHQMSINGKREGFVREDLLKLAEKAGIKKNPARSIIEQVETAVSEWLQLAKEVGIEQEMVERVKKAHRLDV